MDESSEEVDEYGRTPDGRCPGSCSICGKHARDRCEQLTGPCCHKGVSWESCTSGAYTKSVRQRAGLPTP